MTKASVADKAAKGRGMGSSRDLLADETYCATLAKDFGIPQTDVRDAFLNEPMKRALRICAWAEGVEGAPIERGRALTAWAKKHKSGAYRAEKGPEPRSGARHVRPKREKFIADQVMANLDRMGAA